MLTGNSGLIRKSPSVNSFIPVSEKGAPNGVATLGGDGKVPSAQLPSYVDDVVEYPNLASFPVTGETGIIYVALDTNKTYRWSGSTYIEISSDDPNIIAILNNQQFSRNFDDFIANDTTYILNLSAPVNGQINIVKFIGEYTTPGTFTLYNGLVEILSNIPVNDPDPITGLTIDFNQGDEISIKFTGSVELTFQIAINYKVTA